MGAARDLWIRWKMLKLPWRKKFLIGQDLAGNTFWEFKDVLNHNRLRRIVHYNRRAHFADVNITPQWHQWLRQTRPDPPTMQEQAMDVQRQTQLKYNARLADERWAAKAKYIESPKPSPRTPIGGNADLGRHQEPAPGRKVPKTEPTSKEAVSNAVEVPKFQKDDPWEQAKETGSRPGEKWQPDAWVPDVPKRRGV